MLGTSLIVMASTLAQAPGASGSDKPYTSARGGYSVALPAGFVERKRRVSFPGGPVDLQEVYRKRAVALLSVASGDLASEPVDAEAVLAAARDDVVAQARGKLGEDRPVTSGDVPGREFRFEIPRQVAAGGAVGRARVFLAGKRVYEVVAVQSTADATVDPGGPGRFLDSFRIKGVRQAPIAAREARKEPGGSGSKQARPAQTPTGARKDSGDYESRAWGFRVRFPGKPVEKNVLPNNAPGLVVQWNEGTRTYVVVCVKSPRKFSLTASLDAIQGVREGFVGKGKLLSSRDVTSGVLRGKEHSAESDVPVPGTFKKVRAFASGGTIYSVGYSDASPGGSRDRGDPFLESFTIFDPEPFAPEESKLPGWTRVPLPAGRGTILMPPSTRTEDLSTNVKGSGRWKVTLFGGNHANCGVAVVIVEIPGHQGPFGEEDHDGMARQVPGVNRDHPVKKTTTMVDGKRVRLYTFDLKDFKGLGHTVVYVKTLDLNGLLYAFNVIAPPGFEYEPLRDAFFQSYSEK